MLHYKIFVLLNNIIIWILIKSTLCLLFINYSATIFQANILNIHTMFVQRTDCNIELVFISFSIV